MDKSPSAGRGDFSFQIGDRIRNHPFIAVTGHIFRIRMDIRRRIAGQNRDAGCLEHLHIVIIIADRRGMLERNPLQLRRVRTPLPLVTPAGRISK